MSPSSKNHEANRTAKGPCAWGSIFASDSRQPSHNVTEQHMQVTGAQHMSVSHKPTKTSNIRK
eukprot:6491473-Amphidinium_carterae.1